MSICHSVTPLPWDTDFFGHRIQKLVLSGNVNREDLLRIIHRADCTYLFSETVNEDMNRLILSIGGKAFGSNVVYEKMPHRCACPRSENLELVHTISPEILSLTYASGWCSRFYRDTRFSGQFKQFYAKWIENDIRAGDVIAFMRRPKLPAGLITVRTDGECARIGLLAVDGTMRCRGIGRMLLLAAEDMVARRHPGMKLVIATQGGNTPARSLYAKQGFLLMSEIYVWHAWKQDIPEDAQ